MFGTHSATQMLSPKPLPGIGPEYSNKIVDR